MKKNKNQPKNTLDNPHDKALFQSLTHHDVARDAMRAYLPQALLRQADLSRIKLYKTKLVSPQYKEFQADVIYEVPLSAGQKGLFLLHMEHQSRVEAELPLRIWQYLLLLLMEYQQNHRQEPLPVIYPVILYTGERPYHASTDVFSLFGDGQALAKQYLLSPIHLIDVCRMDDAAIKKHKLFGLTEFAFKHKQTQHFRQFLAEYFPWLDEVEVQIGRDYARMMLRYVTHVFTKADPDVFMEEATAHLSKELGEEAMTIAQQLRQQGMRQGIQQGMQLEKRNLAKNLLGRGMSVQDVAELTGLTIEETERLKNPA